MYNSIGSSAILDRCIYIHNMNNQAHITPAVPLHLAPCMRLRTQGTGVWQNLSVQARHDEPK